MKWLKSKFFKEEFVVVGEWDLCHAYKFPHCENISADTETKLYYKNKLLTEEEAYNLYRLQGQTYCKKNIEVRAYAFMLSDGENFALFQNAEDFLTCCAMMNVKTVFWYNAKFDFAIFDYYFLTHDWKDTSIRIGEHKRYGKLPDKTYASLNGEFGQRYQMQIWKEYTNRRDQKKVHKFRMIDICNIFGGGLKRNLEAWKIKDHAGNDVRKLEMDYVEADIEKDLQYMINDTKGLQLLAEAIDETLYKISEYSLFKGDYITAGGLAKKTLLKFMFGQDDKINKHLFKECFPLTAEEDKMFREGHLYQGGKCFVNPEYKGVAVNQIFKFDVNSMYPNQMRNMTYPVGRPKRIENFTKKRKGYCYIVCIKDMFGTLKSHKVPVYQDTLSKDYVEVIREPGERFMWLDELEELEVWYDLEYEIVYALEYTEAVPKGVKKYVDTFYGIKSDAPKGPIREGSKLFLNAAYGKLAQKIERALCTYELDQETGAVHLQKYGVESDEGAMLSVVVGSRITALARVHLMSSMRLICGPNIDENFLYCDTDSIHSLKNYDDCDPHELGKWDREGIYKHALYLAPKTYIMYDNDDHEYEVHCKGVNTNVVARAVESKSFADACTVFRPNRSFKCLCGLNVHGGKALLYVDKFILNDQNMQIELNRLGDLEDVSIA